MSPYKSHDHTKSEGKYQQSDNYSSDKTANLKEKDYTKEKGKRISFQEFLEIYKLNGNVGKDQE